MSSNITLPSAVVRINRRCLSMEYLTFVFCPILVRPWPESLKMLVLLDHLIHWADLTRDKTGISKTMLPDFSLVDGRNQAQRIATQQAYNANTEWLSLPPESFR